MNSLVGAQVGRDEAELLPLLRGVRVDDASWLGNVPVGRLGTPSGTVARKTATVPLIAGHDRGLAAQGERARPARPRSTVAISVVVALVLGPAGHVLDRARRCSGRRPRAAACSCRGHDPVLGVDGDPGHGRVGRPCRRHPGGDPAADRACTRRESGSSFLPPPWGTRPVAFSRKQARVRGGGEQPPAAALLHQGLVVEVRLEAEQREPEPVLAARLAVAAAGVAAELGEDRHDLVGEVDRQVLVGVLDRQRDGHALVAELCDELCGRRWPSAGRGRWAARGRPCRRRRRTGRRRSGLATGRRSASRSRPAGRRRPGRRGRPGSGKSPAP